MSGMRDDRLKDYWEYETRVFHLSAFSGSKKVETDQELKELGSQRFELVSVAPSGEFFVYSFKRLMIRL